MTQPSTSVQLIVFGSRNTSDFDGVLRDVAMAGFPAIEAGNLFAQHGEAKTREALAANNLTVSGAHFGYGEYANPDSLSKHIEYARAMRIKNMMCSGVADQSSAQGYRDSAKLFNEVGKRLQSEGITFNYHNHAWELDDLGGINGMSILSNETDPQLVKFNIDVFWLFYAGLDPAAFVREHANRAGYFHFKDGKRVTAEDGKKRPQFLELGRGDVDLKSAMEAALSVGATWIVAEQDNTQLPQHEAVAISRAYLKQLGV